VLQASFERAPVLLIEEGAVKRLFATCLLFLSGALYAYASDRGAFKSAYAAQDIDLDTDPRSSILVRGRPSCMRK